MDEVVLQNGVDHIRHRDTVPFGHDIELPYQRVLDFGLVHLPSLLFASAMEMPVVTAPNNLFAILAAGGGTNLTDQVFSFRRHTFASVSP